MSQPQPPFTCTHSPGIPELLRDLNCTVAISTYQAGKVVFISSHGKDRLIQLPRTFDKPMGMSFDGERFAVATRDEVVVFANASGMAKNYPRKPQTYDALFVPRASFYTGEVDIHDLQWVNGNLLAVNTHFSCLAAVDSSHSFRPLWKPPFITEVAPGDRCHLNGIAFQNNEAMYATALGQTNTREGWREQKINGGVLIDVRTGRLVAQGLPMPHSPRLYPEGLFFLLSGTGELATVEDGKPHQVLKSFDGFVRGMDRVGDYLFIGLSKLRERSSAFRDLPIASRALFAGVGVVHVPTMSIVGFIRYETSVEEIYDVRILPGITRPNLLSHQSDDRKMAVITPDAEFWALTEEMAKPKSS